MSGSTAIGMVSESLRNLLIGEMQLASPVPVTILAPDEGGGNRRINLFLYKVQENPSLKNLDWQVKRGEPTRLVPPPLSLNLFYLMTSYAPNDLQTGNSTAHGILGEAMRVFYENTFVPQNYLVAGLKDARERIKIIQNTLNLDELSQVWSTFTQPFRLSILYEVSVVQLEMLPNKEKGMKNRVRTRVVPNVHAPFHPPVVENMGSPDFYMVEFVTPLTIEKLCKVISDDGYNINLAATINTIGWLNELLRVSGFYDILHTKKPNSIFSNNITDLVDKTKGYRTKNFSVLTSDEQNNIKRLNRLLVEETYPQQTPKSHNMETLNGPVGTVVTFHGKHLSGWRAYVTMMGRLILDGLNLTKDSFDVTIPSELTPGHPTPPGFYEIQVDISHLFRKTFLFEVIQ